MVLEFEENRTFTSREILSQEVRPKMLDLVLKTRIVKDEKTAGYILMFAAIGIFLISIYIFMSQNKAPELTPAQMQSIEIMKQK